jgi:predicted metallopeptidase
MAQEEKEYTVLTEAKEIIKVLIQRYPQVVWTVQPEKIEVLGVTNKERPKNSRKMATIRKVKGATKALLEHNRIPIEYIIELFCADWQTMSPQKREWLLLHEILHIPAPDEKGMIDHDIQDYAVILDAAGLNWFEREDLPLLTAGDLVPFKEELIVKLHKKDEATEGTEPEEGA